MTTKLARNQVIGEGAAGELRGSDRPTKIAARVLGTSLVFIGLFHVYFGESLTRWLPLWSAAPPGRMYWSRVLGVALGLAALALVRTRTRGAALCTAGVLLVPVLVLHVPRALPTGELGGAWLGVFKWLALAAAPLLLIPPRVAHSGRRASMVTLGSTLAPWLLAVFMFVSAVLHVRQDEFVAQLMQPWLPWRMFWTYFAAVALAAGALGLTWPPTRHLAAALTSLMIFLWFLLVHTPRMLNDPTGPIGWSEMAESLAFSAMALLLSRRCARAPELAAR